MSEINNQIGCTHVYNHIAIVESGGIVSPCCQYIDDRLNDEWTWLSDIKTLDHVLESKWWESLRVQLDDGIKIDGCRSCWRVEEKNAISRRQWGNSDCTVTYPKQIESLEIGLDYTCNMMCRHCKPAQSSKWKTSPAAAIMFQRRPKIYDDRYEMKDYQNKIKSVLENTNLSRLKRLRLVGGEPLYSKNFSWMIDKLKAEADLSILRMALNTNGSIIPSETIIEAFSRMKKVTIDISVDAVGELASCIRHGVEWDIIEGNIIEWAKISRKYKNISVRLHTTLSILNINKLQDIINFGENIGIAFGYHMLHEPDFLSYLQIPLNYREKWQVFAKDIKLSSDLNNIITSQTKPRNHLYDFLFACETLDSVQKLNFKEFNPEIIEIAERHKNDN